MTTWTDEQDLVLVQAIARTRQWREAVRAPVRFVRSDVKRESVVHEFLRAIFEPRES
jgi:hypothetical protein